MKEDYILGTEMVRNAGNKNKGEIVANFKRGRGDNMGIASKLNDNADIPFLQEHIGQMDLVFTIWQEMFPNGNGSIVL